MTSQRQQIQEDTHFRVMRLLACDPNLSQRDLAKTVGISTGAAHYVIKSLIAKGFIKIGNFSAADDKRRYAYILTPKGLSEKAAITKRFLERKLDEYEALKTEIAQLREEMDEYGKPGTSLSEPDGGRGAKS